MTWPLNMAMGELFGFYNFEAEDGRKLQGFSELKALNEKGELVKTGQLKGTMFDKNRKLISVTPEELFPIVDSANKNWTRRQKKGADIGSVVHNAIEHFLLKEPYSIPEEYSKAIEESVYDSPELRAEAITKIEEETDMALLAFGQFVKWWEENQPTLVGAEQIIYSKRYNISGTFDGLIRLNGKLILVDWKTSNASSSEAAAMPEGINYSYFIQSAIYAMAYMEMQRAEHMGMLPAEHLIEDIGIISCRKDGGFTTIFASELGYTVSDCIGWAEAVIIAHRFALQTKKGLVSLAKGRAT